MSLSNPPKSTPSGRLILIGTIKVKPGKEEIVEKHLRISQEHALSDKEPGTFTWRVTRRVDPDGNLLPVFVIIEEYAGAAGLRDHIASPPFQNVMKLNQEEGLFAEELEIDYVDEI